MLSASSYGQFTATKEFWEKKNPYTLTRMPPTQYTVSGEIRSATKLPRRLFVDSTGCRSLGGTQGRGQGDPRGTPKGPKGNPKDPRGPKGNQGTQRTQRDPRGIKGTQGDPRAPSAPSGGWAHGALWGYSEAIPNGKPFRAEGFYERKPAPK